MQTNFTPAQLAQSDMAASEAAIRKCVHCGFCTATCPTYVLLGDELDSPRGRIYLMKDMLENERTPTQDVVTHIDRCLSCLSCMTTCPSDVNYMHLVDHARAYIEKRYRRPLFDRLARTLLSVVIPNRARFRAALTLARLARPLAPILARFSALRPFAAMLRLAGTPLAAPLQQSTQSAAAAGRSGRVVLLRGCVEAALRPAIREAAQRVLLRAGYELVDALGEACCGALDHHLGYENKSLRMARRNIDAWCAEIDGAGLAAIVTTVSGCGSVIKNYEHMLRDDVLYAAKAARVSRLMKDVSELVKPDAPAQAAKKLRVAYHPPCSLQHGQKRGDTPAQALRAAGFSVSMPQESHLCCGSAGVYNILQPDIADQLGDRKAERLDALGADVVATSNIGCMVQLAQRVRAPVVHVVELLDWAQGGPAPQMLISSNKDGEIHAAHA